MKCKSLFSGKNKKNIIILLPAEFARRVVKVNKPNSVRFFDIAYSGVCLSVRFIIILCACKFLLILLCRIYG